MNHYETKVYTFFLPGYFKAQRSVGRLKGSLDLESPKLWFSVFRVRDSGFGGLGFRVEGFRVLRFRFRVV